MSLNISAMFRLESRTSPKNFDAKSASFYVDLDTMAFLMGQKEVVLVHVNNKTEESRTIIMSGQKKIYSALEYRKIKGEKPYLVFRC